MKKSDNLRVVITGANGFVAKNVRNYFSKNDVKLISISRKNDADVKKSTRRCSFRKRK